MTKVFVKTDYDAEMKQIVTTLTKETCIQFALDCFHHGISKLGTEYIDETIQHAIEMASQYKDQKVRMLEAKKAAWKVHETARKKENLVEKYIARAAGHTAATAHVKTHCMGSPDYILSAFNQSHLKDEIVHERRWQYEHLLALSK